MISLSSQKNAESDRLICNNKDLMQDITLQSHIIVCKQVNISNI